jgi:hypothetical protein
MEDNKMTLYSYDGPVLEFDRVVADNWHAETCAASEAKAYANLAFRFKQETGRVPRTKITLPGKLVSQGVD